MFTSHNKATQVLPGSLLTVKGFNIFFWNARSLYNKLESFRLFVGEHTPDVFCVNETWFKNNMPDSMISLDGYNSTRHDRSFINPQGYIKRGGGIVTYLRKGLDYLVLDSAISNPDIECSLTRINRPCTKAIYIINIYRPPTGNIDNFSTHLTEIITNLENRDKSTIIIGGDFNIDFSKQNSKGVTILKKLSKRFSLEQQIKTTTRPLYGTAIIDQILTNSQIVKEAGTVDLNISDHVPVYINLKKPKLTFPKTTFTCRTYRNFQNENFVQQMRLAGFEQITNQGLEVNELWEKMYKIITEILDKLAPMRVSMFRKSRPEWLTAEIMEMMKDRDRALKAAKMTQDLEDKKRARKLRNHLNTTIKLAKNQYMLEKLETYKKDPKKFWQTIQDILPKSNSSSILLHNKDGTPMNDSQTGECINDFFSNVGSNLASKIPECTPVLTYPTRENVNVDDLIFEDITMKEVEDLNKKICIYKSSGIMTISSRIWKIIYQNFPLIFTNLYNQIINDGIYPEKWKIATVVPIPKVSLATNPNELRPISLLPLPGKLLEHLIHKPLMRHLENNHLLNMYQNGFRPKRSTIQTVFEYTTDLYQNYNKNKNTTAVYVDLRKAFDTVSHEILLKKLKGFKISDKYHTIFRNYLTNRQQQTLINNTVSKLMPVPYGVPQGSVLGPTFFILYINDVIEVIRNCSCYLYADDMVLYRTIEGNDCLRDFQTDMDNVYEWCKRNKLTINIEKTKAQLFPKSANIDSLVLQNNNPIQIDNKTLHYDHTFRYLGIDIDQQLTMKPVRDAIYRNATHKLYIYRLVRSSLTMSAAVQVLKAMFLSVLDYGNIFLTGINKNSLSDLQKLQNDAIRCCLKIKQPRDAHVVDIHERLDVHLLEHRRIVQLLTCIKKGVTSDFLPHINIDDAVLRNQGLKITLPIPRNDLIKKSPYYWGSTLWNRLPLEVKTMNDLLTFKKTIYHMLMDRTLQTDFVI